jgi:hypothetical protein
MRGLKMSLERNETLFAEPAAALLQSQRLCRSMTGTHQQLVLCICSRRTHTGWASLLLLHLPSTDCLPPHDLAVQTEQKWFKGGTCSDRNNFALQVYQQPPTAAHYGLSCIGRKQKPSIGPAALRDL